MSSSAATAAIFRSLLTRPGSASGLSACLPSDRAFSGRSWTSIITPWAPAAAAATGVDHVVVRTADAEAAKHLYGRQLGIRLALDRSFEQWGARLLFFRIGGLTIEIAASIGEPVEPGAADDLWGVAYRVPDADAARERLAGEGFDVTEVRRGRRPGTRVFTVRAETHGVATLCLEENAPAVDGETASAS